MESIAVLSHGAGLVSVVAVAVAMLLAGLMFLVFRMNPGPDYKEVFRKQREQLMAMDEPKQKKKEKPAKKNKDKAKEKKDRSVTPTQTSLSTSSPTSVGTPEGIEEKAPASTTLNNSASSGPAVAKDQVHSAGHNAGAPKHHHDHVDFADKEDVKLVELDQPPKVEPGRILSGNRQPGKPILVHTDASTFQSGGETASANDFSANSAPAFIRSNSFKDLRPMDEVELHHKKHQSPSKSTASKAGSKDAKDQNEEKVVKEDKASQQVASPQKKQQQHAKEQNHSNTVAVKKDSAVLLAAAPAATTAAPTVSTKKGSPQHEVSGGRKERKVFSKKELRELINQIEHNELPPDMGEDTIQHLVDALLNHQNDSKEWRSTRQDPMQQLKRSLQEREEQVVLLTEQLNSSLARGKEIHTEMALWKTRFGQTQAAITQMENRFREESSRLIADTQRVEGQLREAETVIEQLRSRNAAFESMQQELKTSMRRQEEAAALEKQTLVQQTAAEVEKACAESLNQVRAELEEARAELEQIRKSSAEELESEKRQWETRVKQAEGEIARLQENLRDSQTQLEQAKKDVIAAHGAHEASSGDKERLAQEAVALKEEVEQLKNRNTQLHEKNWATVEAMNQAEQKYRDLYGEQSKQRKLLVESLPKSAQASIKDVDSKDFAKVFITQLKQLSKEVEKADTEVKALREKNKFLEGKLQQVTEAKEAAVAAGKKQAAVEVSSSRMRELEIEVDNLREEAVRLRAENSHYSGVLTKTEKILQDLQDSVEGEERRWAEDRYRFEAERAEMSAAVRELESKLKELQQQLEDVEGEKSNVQSQLDNCRVDLDKANQQLAASIRAAQEAKTQAATVSAQTTTAPVQAVPVTATGSGSDVSSVDHQDVTTTPSSLTKANNTSSSAEAPQHVNGQCPLQQQQCQQVQLNGSEDSSPSPTHSTGSGQANGGGGHDGIRLKFWKKKSHKDKESEKEKGVAS